MRLTTEGIIIRDQNLGEEDRLVTVLTSGFGVLRAFVRGAKKIKSRLGSATQLFSYARFTVFQGKDKYIIDEAEPIEVFFKLRLDIEKLSLAQYFAELITALVSDGVETGEILRLFLNTLHLMSEGKRHNLMLKAVFEMRMMALSGYAPDLLSCQGCGCFEAEIMHFDIQSGELFCPDCRQEGKGISLSKGILSALRHIVYAEGDKLFSFTLPPAGCKRLSEITESYTAAHLGRRFQTLEFYHSIAIDTGS